MSRRTTRRPLRRTAVAAAAAALALSPLAQGTALADTPVRTGLDSHISDNPYSPAQLTAQLTASVAAAIKNQQANGSFEIPGRTKDVGDNSLGVTSLLAYQWSSTGQSDASLVGPVRRSVDYYLNNRVYTTDNTGSGSCVTVKNSGDPYAIYGLGSDNSPTGDWPTTVWALLHAVNTLQYGQGLLTADQYDRLLTLAQGYWKWLTVDTKFNCQQAQNQAIGTVDGGLLLANLLDRAGNSAAASTVRAKAMDLYTNTIRPARGSDRGYHFFQEHNSGFDQNYGAIALSFVTEAYFASGNPVFLQDGEEHARYLDLRMSTDGFDYGGPRHNEARDNSADALGLRFYSNDLHDDLGRYLTIGGKAFTPTASGVPIGHFAFDTVWLLAHPSTFATAAQSPVNSPYKLRQGATSIVFDPNLSPYLVSSGQSQVLGAVDDGQTHGIGPSYTDSTGATYLFTPVAGQATSTELNPAGYSLKLVTQPSTDGNGATLTTRTAYLSDGRNLYLVSAGDAGTVGNDGQFGYLFGLPYLTTQSGTAATQQKILGVSSSDGQSLSFGADGSSLTTAGTVGAGGLQLAGPAGVTVSNPTVPSGGDPMDYFNSSASLRMPLEQYSLARDPGKDTDRGWNTTQRTNLLQAPAPAAQPGQNLVTTSGCYGPTGGCPAALTANTVTTDAFAFGLLDAGQQLLGVQVSAPTLVFINRTTGETVRQPLS
ncbi:hypothetical protein [Kitasatospora sp. NPDC089509]|uniref:hypothetical protein n=1 Tax=Kitasatospora sp. NPDC089509 TaxID=3364079 RepID=UPI0037FCFB59